MSEIKADVKLRNSCMNAECFHPKVQVVDLDTAIECVYQATEEGRKEGADTLIEQASFNGQKKYIQGMNFMKYQAIEAFKENCQHPKDTEGCECKLCVRWVAGHCELLDGFIEKLNS